MQSSLTVHIRGLNGVIFHNGRLADPLNAYARRLKSLTTKRKKTDEEHIEAYRIEWEGGLYLNAEGNPVVPGQNIEALLCKAASKFKAKGAVKGGVRVDEDSKLKYDGPPTLEGLRPEWENFSRRDVVRNPSSGSRVVRCRPFFQNWELVYTVTYDTEIMNRDQLENIINKTPEIGLLEWSPRFGRFQVVSIRE